MKLKNELYDAMKFMAQILLPAAGTLYFAIAGIWSLPAATQVIGTLTAVDTFLGAILSLSSKNYVQATDGRLLVDKTSPIKDSYSLELTTPLDKLDSMSHVTVEVQTKTLGSLTTPKTKNGDNSD